ncbi:hypothetical protein [Flavobacterium sp. H122]|uniref:hypothetical protein n=1 Tax=Flavobacterium sp. H122 TaxID=2529860 RepID=UPI0010A9D5AD|nr:hypothetical protein [Flavobacterium sp. H122]
MNSLKKTFCVFEEVGTELIQNLAPDFISDSGSKYYYTQKGMYRFSNHWGRLANSKWRLTDKGISAEKDKIGFAEWDNFYPDNEFEKLYYIEWDRGLNDVLYQHRNNPDYDSRAVLRTSKETQKRLKNARNILQLSNWARYFETDITILREMIIQDLIYTDLSLDEIKRKYL